MARPGSQHPINCPFHHSPWESGAGPGVRSGLWPQRGDADAGEDGDNDGREHEAQ